MEVIFSPNRDRKTCNMLIDNFLINEDIPFIPKLAVDHRGCTLYYYAKENGIALREFNLDEETFLPSEVIRGYNYMSNPVHVLESINERINDKKNGKSTRPRI